MTRELSRYFLVNVRGRDFFGTTEKKEKGMNAKKVLGFVFFALFIGASVEARTYLNIGADPVDRACEQKLIAGETVLETTADVFVHTRGGSGRLSRGWVPAGIRFITVSTADPALRRAVRIAVCCNPVENEILLRIPVPSPAPRAEVPVASRPVPVLPPAAVMPDDVTIRVRVWQQRDGISRSVAATEGFQSRDLGPQLREAARKGELPAYSAVETFPTEIVSANGERRTFAVAIRNGEGAVTVSKRWLLEGPEDPSVRSCSPWRKPDLHYPPSGCLSTRPGELREAFTKWRVLNLHFVK